MPRGSELLFLLLALTGTLEESQESGVKRSGCERGCVSVLIALVGLFFLARMFGGVMGDYIGPPEKLAEHNAEMKVWFWTSFLGLTASVAAGVWWSKINRR